MIFKLLLLTVISVTFAQCNVTKVSYANLRIIENEDLENLENILTDLKELVESAIEKAKNELIGIKDKIQHEAEKVITVIKEKLSEQLGPFLGNLGVIKEKAEKLGIKIKDCIGDNEDKLLNLAKDFGNGILDCGKQKIEEGKSLVEDAKAAVENTIARVKALVEEFKSCEGESWWSRLPCQIAASAKIAWAVINLPLDITSTVTGAIKLVTTLYTDLRACGMEKVTEALAEGQEIVGGIAKCVEGKVTPTLLLEYAAKHTRAT